jgi:hypothetical protein
MNITDAYVLVEIDPSHILLGELNRENPPLALVVGQRYQVTVADADSHPLEIIAGGPHPDQDRVLLSMQPRVTTPFENDRAVDWYESGYGTARFTLTPDLWAALQGDANEVPGYRCAVHAQSMRGPFTVTE